LPEEEGLWPPEEEEEGAGGRVVEVESVHAHMTEIPTEICDEPKL
jgi:hypothetical protein